MPNLVTGSALDNRAQPWERSGLSPAEGKVRPIALMPQGCATPSSARQREPRPASHATLPLTPRLTLPLRRPTPSPHTRLLTAYSHSRCPVAQSPPPLCVPSQLQGVLPVNYHRPWRRTCPRSLPRPPLSIEVQGASGAHGNLLQGRVPSFPSERPRTHKHTCGCLWARERTWPPSWRPAVPCRCGLPLASRTTQAVSNELLGIFGNRIMWFLIL